MTFSPVTRTFGVPGDRDGLLQAMDFNLWDMFREDIRLARGGHLFEANEYWMGYSPRGTHFHNMVMVRRALAIDRLLQAVDEFYRPRNSVHSIWVRDHADADLERELRARGYVDFTSMPGMVLLGDPGTECAPPDLEIRPVVDDRGRVDFLYVSAEAYATYDTPREYAEDAFAFLESLQAPHIQGFVGYVAGKPAAAAAVYLTHGVAGIGWVGTVPEQRRRGYAEAVTWTAVREGFRRGASFANLQASVMGAPIYERMGFITMTEYRVLIRADHERA